MSRDEEPSLKKRKKEKKDTLLPPLEEFPVDFAPIDPAVVKLIRRAFRTLTKKAADAARESTMPFMMSDFATVQMYNDVYATAQLIYAESLLNEEEMTEDIAKESLRAIDLAVLRGGIEKWADVARIVATRAEKLLPTMGRSQTVPPPIPTHKTEKLPPYPYLQNDPNCINILRVDASSMPWTEFRDTYMTSAASPVIITNAMDSWPALRLWQDMAYIKEKASVRLVPIETYAEKDSTQTYLSPSWEQRVMSVGEFIETHLESSGGGEEGAEKAYLAQYQLFDQIPSLREDILIPEYCNALTEVDTNAPSSEFADMRAGDNPIISAWFGPAGTVSPLHNDPYSNILAQVIGRKYLRLYDMKETDSLYPRDGFQCNNSSVDIDHVDESKFPLFSAAKSHQCVLESGEMLFIPRHWWHYVRSLDVSFSVSFWFGAKMGLSKNPSTGKYESVY